MGHSQKSSSSGSVAVIGAGISGLAAAYRLHKEGVSVTVFEADGKVGGKLTSQSENGYVWDFGPNSMVENSSEVSSLIDDLQLREKQQFPVLQNKRYILLDGKPVLLPSNPFGILGTNVLSTKSKLQILLEPFLWKRKPAVQEATDNNSIDECVGDFLGRHLGSEAVDNLVDPFIAGTTGSDPNSLSARLTFPDLWALEQSYGSFIVGGIKSKLMKKPTGSQVPPTEPSASPPKSKQLKGSFSFAGGLQTIANALAERIGRTNIQLNTAVVALASKQQGNPARDEWTVASSNEDSRNKAIQRHFDAVILTAPLHTLQGIPFHRDGKHFPLDFIPEVTYQPMSVVITAFKKEDVMQPLQGFGVLVPAKEQANGFQTLGTLFSSSMFPDRAPSDQVLFTSFVGGSRNRKLAAAPFDELSDVVLNDLKRIVGVKGEPLTVRHFYWERAFPQYGLKYGRVIESLERLEKSFPGLFYAGNHRGGLAVGKALLSGYEAAGRVLESLETSGGRIFTMA